MLPLPKPHKSDHHHHHDHQEQIHVDQFHQANQTTQFNQLNQYNQQINQQWSPSSSSSSSSGSAKSPARHLLGVPTEDSFVVTAHPEHPGAPGPVHKYEVNFTSGYLPPDSALKLTTAVVWAATEQGLQHPHLALGEHIAVAEPQDPTHPFEQSSTVITLSAAALHAPTIYYRGGVRLSLRNSALSGHSSRDHHHGRPAAAATVSPVNDSFDYRMFYDNVAWYELIHKRHAAHGSKFDDQYVFKPRVIDFAKLNHVEDEWTWSMAKTFTPVH